MPHPFLGKKKEKTSVFSFKGRQKTLFFDGSARDFPAAKINERVFAAVGKP
ncbi:MAG: hypothetical protein ACOX88_03565 [Christensenellales bacterium]